MTAAGEAAEELDTDAGPGEQPRRVEPYQAPKGTQDILPPQSARWERLVALFSGIARRAGYGLVVSPMFEDAAVFKRGVGASTDIVTKEMYEFDDMAGRHLALRPEGTASIVRAFAQHTPAHLPWKTWYVTPCFRQESPQAGRYRQHHQVGVEVIGTDDPDADVEVIAILDTLYRGLGLIRYELRINSMGDAECTPGFKARLVAYLEANEDSLCDEHRTRWRLNPLRFFDCKKPECRAVRSGAPRIADNLCEPCRSAFGRVEAGLDALGIAYRRDEYLVRGFDYYTRTTFEFASVTLTGSQDAIGGGGRYDGLSSLLGGPPESGIGFGAGIERILLACDAEGVFGAGETGPDVFVADMTGGDVARDLTHELRAAGFAADRSFGSRSLKSQLRSADRSGASLAVIVGSDEVAAGEVTLRRLRHEGGPATAGLWAEGNQVRVARADLAGRLREALGR